MKCENSKEENQTMIHGPKMFLYPLIKKLKIEKQQAFKLLITIIILFSSCGKMHDSIYGEQIIEITNSRYSAVKIVIESANHSQTKDLGGIEANSTKTFRITWRNDCYFIFHAYSGESLIQSTGEIDTCGGTTWIIR
jgi:hypothetical protein